MKIFKILTIFFCSMCFSQENNILTRLSALNNNGKIWYNIDGYSVTSEVFNNSFDEKGLSKVLKKHKISDSELKTRDEKINSKNFFVTKQQKISGNSFQTNNYYFVENPNKTITVVWFIKNGKTDQDTEEKLVNAIIENRIPEENFVSMNISSINFAGRKIELGNNCYWTFLNIVQCPYAGEMNWSVHRTLQDAKEAVENQLNVTKSKGGGKITSEEMIDINFLDVPTKAKKIVYDFTGLTSVLTKMSGGKSLTIYYIAENIRDQNISCVISFWNNDEINPQTKLPALPEKLMKLN
ncbi:hypothetical protein RAH57_01800 [Chryseobacterium sp. CKR4-1]|uniref:hypothetical protein n=1 Tax=Chryseobacterium sp. CKR4-1 TaxID=3068896 RepID=UPI002796A530|nr:hypothetical protein [Chryseobacterium sp. CKR4-1]MDQ1802701.1 hypothetical protein [Chryseobacterium sp. CKR4-1]